MSEDPLPGYTGVVRKVLSKAGVSVGDKVRIVTSDGRVFVGVLMPRYSIKPKPIIVLKLDNGYNVGIRIDEGTVVELVKTREAILREAAAGAPAVIPLLEEKPAKKPQERIMVVGTGGTIASKIEYETGAVKPALTAEDLVEAVPEIAMIARIEADVLMNILSENMKPKYWVKIVDAIARHIDEGYDGIIVAHGTDTMTYTASAIAFAFRGLPVPIAFVGSQRSSDRPSSDAAFNLIAATLYAAKSDYAEVAIVMHGETGDTYALANRAVKTRKMHTSRRDAFQPINDRPLMRIYPFEKRLEPLQPPLHRRGEQELRVENGFEEKVALVKYYPGMDGEIIDFLVDRGYKGIILEGTGLGHVGEWLVEPIRRAVDNGVVVVMTSQTLFGRINMNVYNTGRKLLAAGVIPGDDMLPEVAFVKLSWILAHTSSLDEAKRLMRTNLAGEINPRLTVDLYPRWLQ